jgi:hypothetical protein
VTDFITLAEAKLSRDQRVRKLDERTLTTVASTDYVTLPSDFKAVEALYYDGDNRRGEINVVPADKLPMMKLSAGPTGLPVVGSIVGSRLYLAPVPDGAYSLYLKYESVLPSLSATLTSNWLLESHPDVYLYAALVEAEPYLRDDERIALWQGQLEQKLEHLAKYTDRQEYTGRLVMRPRLAIG